MAGAVAARPAHAGGAGRALPRCARARASREDGGASRAVLLRAHRPRAGRDRARGGGRARAGRRAAWPRSTSSGRSAAPTTTASSWPRRPARSHQHWLGPPRPTSAPDVVADHGGRRPAQRPRGGPAAVPAAAVPAADAGAAVRPGHRPGPRHPTEPCPAAARSAPPTVPFAGKDARRRRPAPCAASPGSSTRSAGRPSRCPAAPTRWACRSAASWAGEAVAGDGRAGGGGGGGGIDEVAGSVPGTRRAPGTHASRRRVGCRSCVPGTVPVPGTTYFTACFTSRDDPAPRRPRSASSSAKAVGHMAPLSSAGRVAEARASRSAS